MENTPQVPEPPQQSSNQKNANYTVMVIVFAFCGFLLYNFITNPPKEKPTPEEIAIADSIKAVKEQARKDSIYNAASPEERKILDAQEKRRQEYEAKKEKRKQMAEKQKKDNVYNHSYDNSVACVIVYLQNNLNDPDSYEEVKWYDVEYDEKSGIYTVRHKYRAKNPYGAKMLADQVFHIAPGGTVLGVEDYK